LQILKKEEAIPWPGTLAIVHSYIAYKEGGCFTALVAVVTVMCISLHWLP